MINMHSKFMLNQCNQFVGIPLTPTFGNLLPGSTATEIGIQIKTIASGESPGFRFNIIPVRNGTKEPQQVFMNVNYQSGTFVTLTVGDLTGGTYTFSATAENNFGESGVANSRSIVIGGLSFVYPFIKFINSVHLLYRISNSFCWASTNAKTRLSPPLSLSLSHKYTHFPCVSVFSLSLHFSDQSLLPGHNYREAVVFYIISTISLFLV